MSSLVSKPNVQLVDADFTSEQISLIKSTVAKGASDSELQLFLYRAKNLGLDPLKPGQIYFIKYGTNPGTIVVGIDGIRAKAARTNKLKGIRRGVTRDEKGKCIGAWCEVYRADWDHPAKEEVAMSEYNTGKSQWAKMPETMIKKVAEAAALRMAFPDELGGIYSEEEMHQAREISPTKANQVNRLLESPEASPDLEIESAITEEFDETEFVTEAAANPPDLGEYVIQIGKKYKGKKLKDVSKSTLSDFAKWVDDNIEHKNDDTVEFLSTVSAYLEQA